MSRVIATANTPSLNASIRPVSFASSFIVSIPGSIHGKMIDDNGRINRGIPGKIIRGYRKEMAAYREFLFRIKDRLSSPPNLFNNEFKAKNLHTSRAHLGTLPT